MAEDALAVVVKFLKEKKGGHPLTAVAKHTQISFDDALMAEIRSSPKLDYNETTNTLRYKPWLHDLDTIIKFLDVKRGPQTLLAVKQYTKVNPEELEKEIETCPKISYDPKELTLCYRPKLEATNQHTLLKCLKEQRGGVPLTDIADCYIGVQEDVDDLVARNELISVYNPDSKSFVIFSRDTSEELQLSMPEKLRALWTEVEMPNNKNDLDRKLMSMGHLSRTEGERPNVGLVATQKQRKQPGNIKRRRTTLTNTHLLESMPWLKPT